MTPRAKLLHEFEMTEYLGPPLSEITIRPRPIYCYRALTV